MAFQPFDLSGRVALITGGNGGIGLGMARGLVESGAGNALRRFWGRFYNRAEWRLGWVLLGGFVVGMISIPIYLAIESRRGLVSLTEREID